jgi:hypothetical protein
MKKFIAFLVLVFAVISSGCGITPRQGAVLGGVAGNVIEGSSRGTAIGAVAGFLAADAFGQSGGSYANQCRGINGMVPVCHTGRLVCLNGDFACEHTQAGFGQSPLVRGGYQGPMVCGPAQYHMSCPSIQVEGRDCRRCQ